MICVLLDSGIYNLAIPQGNRDSLKYYATLNTNLIHSLYRKMALKGFLMQDDAYIQTLHVTLECIWAIFGILRN